MQCVSGEEGGVLVCDDANQTVACDDVPHQRPAAEDDMEDYALRCVHREKDFTSLLSSTPGWFILKCTHSGDKHR